MLLRSFVVVFVLIRSLSAEPAAKPDPLYETRAVASPDGIGKLFMGREIAHVMGHLAADWLERPEREREEKTEQMLDALKFSDGEVVADIGCGSGYISRRIAKRVGKSGLVYGVDIQPEMLELLGQTTREAGLENVKPILGEPANPKLPDASCDTMIMVDVYHEFDQPYEMLEAMIKALKPGGRIVFVEYREEDPAVPIKRLHKMSEAQVRKEMSVQPLEFEANVGNLPWQHVLVFRKPKPKATRTDDCCDAAALCEPLLSASK